MTNPPVNLDQAIRTEIDRAVQELKGGDPSGFTIMAADELEAALHAVLDLHSRRELTAEECAAWRVPRRTALCVGAAHANGLRGGLHAVYWPCPTVRVIAEKLGVEVDSG